MKEISNRFFPVFHSNVECPYCGRASLTLDCMAEGTIMYQMLCDNCGARGPQMELPQDACNILREATFVSQKVLKVIMDCPWCESAKGVTVQGNEDTGYYVDCMKCQCNTSIELTADEAKKMWYRVR